MRILLVNQPDDLANLLRQHGLEVRSVADGGQARDVALAFAPDAAVLDDDVLALSLKTLAADDPPLTLALGGRERGLAIDFIAADADEVLRLLKQFE